MELEPRLKKIRDWADTNLSKAENDIMENHIQFLRSSGALTRVLKVGDQAPAFKLKNQKGEMIASTEMLKHGPLVVSFYRGSWCPYCVEEVKVLNDLYPNFKEAGAELVVVSPQGFAKTEKQATEHHLRYNLLVDTENETGKKFGLVYSLPDDLRDLYLNKFKNDLTQVNESANWELPIPARFVIGQDGKILSAKVDPDYRFRPEPSETLEFVRKLR